MMYRVYENHAYAKNATAELINTYNQTKMNCKETYIQKSIPHMQKMFGFSNALKAPKITKVAVNVGVGRIKDENQLKEIQRILSLVTGQKAVPRKAKKAIASFKTRVGMVIGYSVTLRGKRMYDFLDRFISVALPRTRDFRGIPLQSFDSRGNLTVGIKEHIVFPELIGEDVRFIFGLEVTITTTSKKREHGIELLRSIGFPIQEK